MSTSSRQNTRFSTLNVFKFGSSPKPPPPPPKDSYYQPNHSFASLAHTLSPETCIAPLPTQSAQPTTPVSAGYAHSARSPSPSPSYAPSCATSSYASSSLMAQSTTSLSTTAESTTGKKGFFKSFSLSKKLKTPKSQTVDLPGDQPEPDDSISLPWNFQMRIHAAQCTRRRSVRPPLFAVLCRAAAAHAPGPSRFAGLPPTWSASLAQMGFSEEEIAAIHARRSERRPTLYALRSDSGSPGSSSHSVVMRPNPRSSSLMHNGPDVDAMSQRSGSSYAADVSRDISTSIDYSDISTSEGAPSTVLTNTPRSLVRSPDMMSVSQRSYRDATPASPSPPPLAPEPGPSRVVPLSKDRPPTTPTKRSYHVANESTSTIYSPPPAYASPKKESELGDVVEDLVLPPALGSAAVPLSSTVETEEGEEEIVGNDPSTRAPSSRLSVLPPRLSLHQEDLSDLSSWTESLFSMLPSEKESHRDTLRPKPTQASSVPTPQTPPRTRDPRFSTVPSRASLAPSIKPRSVPPPKPLPLHVQQSRPTTPPSPAPPSLPVSSTDPLWQEVYNMVRTPGSGSGSPSPSPLFLSTPKTVASPATSDEADHDHNENELRANFSPGKENRDSSMSTITVTPATIVRHISVAKRARANVIQPRAKEAGAGSKPCDNNAEGNAETAAEDAARSNSPASSDSHSSDASSGSVAMSTTTLGTGSSASSSDSRRATMTLGEAQKWKSSSLLDSHSHPPENTLTMPYVESSPQPSPTAGQFQDSGMITPASVRSYRETDQLQALQRPSIVIDDISTGVGAETDDAPWSATSSTASPLSPSLTRSHSDSACVAALVEPLKDYIKADIDPRGLFTDLQEIAEGESGSVYAARLASAAQKTSYVAIKKVVLRPEGSQKLKDLERELHLMRTVNHTHILSMEELYIAPVEDAMWIRMELMDRSLADILNLSEQGIVMEEKHISRFAADVVAALSYLHKQGIAHRDVRSDNLLVNGSGFVKLADFSSAVEVNKMNPVYSGVAGVIYWQAPEMRSGPYNALKVDVWSLGATVWELAEAEPPFADVTDPSQLGDRWPPLQQANNFSRSFQTFLRLCSEPSKSRPNPDDLLHDWQLIILADSLHS
ncbi:hypothetical protein EIP86_004646 [Pleurotus ostreatoroseus]|nr:hypothetical protein EIP86_004646 [Pleurotus ostreatoroseus]